MSYHERCMNVPCPGNVEEVGHKNARHQCAEIAAEADAEISKIYAGLASRAADQALDEQLNELKSPADCALDMLERIEYALPLLRDIHDILKTSADDHVIRFLGMCIERLDLAKPGFYPQKLQEVIDGNVEAFFKDIKVIKMSRLRPRSDQDAQVKMVITVPAKGGAFDALMERFGS